MVRRQESTNLGIRRKGSEEGEWGFEGTGRRGRVGRDSLLSNRLLDEKIGVHVNGCGCFVHLRVSEKGQSRKRKRAGRRDEDERSQWDCFEAERVQGR